MVTTQPFPKVPCTCTLPPSCAGVAQRLVLSETQADFKRGEPHAWEAVMRSARKNSMLCMVSPSVCSAVCARSPHTAAHARSTRAQHTLAAALAAHAAHARSNSMQHPLAATLTRSSRHPRTAHAGAHTLSTTLTRRSCARLLPLAAHARRSTCTTAEHILTYDEVS